MLRKNRSQIESLILDRLVPWIGAFLIVLAAASQVSVFYDWGIKGPFMKIFVFLQTNALILWLSVITIGVIVLWRRTSRLYQRFTVGFRDKFENLNHWDYQGNWSIKEGILIVTDSDDGGITKTGKNWENYTFDFKARIVNECLGVIVRAQDLYNYHMFQIRTDKIRPHLREVFPTVITEKVEIEGRKKPSEHQVIISLVRWHTDEIDLNPAYQPVPLKPELEGWFDVEVEVRGESVSIHIGKEGEKKDLVFNRDSYLQIPAGKVGFRNYGTEEAHIKDVQVMLHP